MPTANSELDAARQESVSSERQEPVYRPTFVSSYFVFSSLWQQLRERRREAKITVPPEYYRGEASLPVTDMAGWFKDLREQLRARKVKPAPPSIPITSQPVEVPEFWQDYNQEPASWLNSVVVNVLLVLALLLPYAIKAWLHPPAKTAEVVPIDISPYLPNLPPSAKRAGGGGGGGDRTPSPPSKGAVPKFSKVQLAPPMAVIPNPTPKLPVEPTLLGPPTLKLPQMTMNMNWGDPTQAAAAASNGPGTGGGIGTGAGTGIGSGNGGGLGPGSGGNTGGGVYAVGGNVSQPIPIYEPDPPYSEEARKAKYQGTVVLSIIVDAQGAVHNVQVVKPLGLGLDENALRTVKTWKFKPAERNGVPVAVQVTIEISFRLF